MVRTNFNPDFCNKIVPIANAERTSPEIAEGPTRHDGTWSRAGALI